MKTINKSELTYNKENEKEIFNEINILKRMAHPNIFKIFELYSNVSNIFFVINYCHKINIIHRDLKQENILIAKREKRIIIH